VTEVTAAVEAGHAFGAASESYARVASAVDGCVGDLVQAIDDGETTFVIVSDHGHIDRRGGGGHGGGEEEVMRVPLVLAGKATAPGSGWEAQMTDVAPTISALLGLPLPATNQGKILSIVAGPHPGCADFRPVSGVHDLRRVTYGPLRIRSRFQPYVFSSTLSGARAIIHLADNSHYVGDE
jgi:arylsulfatase A-like enzyme